jgi:hypothetical protein
MCNRSDALSRPVLMVRGLDGFFVIFPPVRFGAPVGGQLCGFQGPGEGLVSQPFGGDSEGDTPLPIPNREVKPLSADGTWASRPWESRSPPVLTEKGRPTGGGPFHLVLPASGASASGLLPGLLPRRESRAGPLSDAPTERRASSGSRWSSLRHSRPSRRVHT